MDLKLLMTVFGTVFLAELADKTQLATLLFASNAQHEKITVFLGSSFALILASAIAVTIGSALSHWIPPKYMSYIAGILFIGIGIWILVKA
ncbi:MAG: UPF0016 family protein [Deltaproteobacteria bacterium]|nr:TMEM165/GDT1 family protein [Deltaproteobacteria bacterium]RLC08604.1 MAG: UPF0016 family protein [Deltaproteobacteria bacterium]